MESIEKEEEKLSVDVDDLLYFISVFSKNKNRVNIITPKENDPLFNCINEIEDI